MAHENDTFSLIGKLTEYLYNFLLRITVKVARRFVGKNDIGILNLYLRVFSTDRIA